MKKKRRWWAALLYGLWLPGLGHVYEGEARRAITVYLVCVTLSGIGILLLVDAVVPALLTLITSLLIMLWAAVSAAIGARRKGLVELKWYNKWYVYPLLGVILMVATNIVSSLLRREYVEAFNVPSTTMEPTILEGDHILINKRSYSDSLPKRGDIVVFSLPDDPQSNVDESAATVIKRIVAVGGDTIELTGTKLRINGELVEEPYAIYLLGGRRGLPKMAVPQGTFVALGDNRDHSRDSRYWESPYVSKASIKGRVFAIYWAKYKRQRIGRRLDIDS